MRLTLTACVCPLPSVTEMLRSKQTLHTWIQLFKLKYRDKMFQGLASSRKKSCDSPNGASFRHTRTGDLFTPIVSPEWIQSGRNSLTALVSQQNSANHWLWVIRSAWFTFRFYFLILVFTTNLCILFCCSGGLNTTTTQIPSPLSPVLCLSNFCPDGFSCTSILLIWYIFVIVRLDFSGHVVTGFYTQYRNYLWFWKKKQGHA